MNKKILKALALVSTCVVAVISYNAWDSFGGVYYGVVGFFAVLASTIIILSKKGG